MSVRERIEANEAKYLSPYACLSSKTRGRERIEKECDIRTPFQRDRDRIIHSKSFRRLKHKTQVFISPEGDHYRTRLTHTLEVAQIARTIAIALNLNEHLTEAIALGHDLGHTPFGHAGEDVLNEIVPGGFKHNEQSLRVVDKLEMSGNGLNLTWEVRDGILNHTGPIKPATLEGQIVKIADRIAYINHDIDDALRAGVILENQLPKDCIRMLGEKHSQRINTMVRNMIEHSWEKPEISMSSDYAEMTNKLRKFMFENVYVGSVAKKEEKNAKRILRELFYFFVENIDIFSKEKGKEQSEENIEQKVCDYVAGMTDRYALKMYEKYFLPSPWLLNK